MQLDELYQELILDHHKNPRHKGVVQNPSVQFQMYNPLCGDEISVSLKVDQGKVSDIAFIGHGCSISQASASMMTELCAGKTVEQVDALAHLFHSMIKGEDVENRKQQLGDALALEGVKKFAARTRCALLGWEAVEQALLKLRQ